MEYIVEHVAKQAKLDALQVRTTNLYKKGDLTPFKQPLPYFNVDTLIDQLKMSCDYDKRVGSVADFNKANRWIKKGISLVPVKWGVGMLRNPVPATVSILTDDGSVIITHSGVELGQGT